MLMLVIQLSQNQLKQKKNSKQLIGYLDDTLVFILPKMSGHIIKILKIKTEIMLRIRITN